MNFVELVEASADIAATRSRLKKTERLKAVLEAAEPEEIPLVASYLSGRMPQGRVGVGYQTLESLRDVPASTEPTLSLADVDLALQSVDQESGPGSSGRRSEWLRDLFQAATGGEQSFLRRLLTGELRHGSLEGIMVDAVAKAAELPLAPVRRALMLSGELGDVARAALLEGTEGIEQFRIELFRPVQPMLAQTADDVEAAVETLGRAALEEKLDGARIQVHKLGDDVRVFTRRLNDVTAACPEVVELVRALPVESAVLDGETLALKKDGRPHPFQVTMRRFGRRLDVAAMQRALPLTALFFDVLLLDGESLIDLPLEARLARLGTVLPESASVRRIVTDDGEEARRFAESVLEAGHEGVMAKALDAPYEAGSRGKAWLKVKTAHTLDLVVLAAEWGSGRRKGWLSNLHLGARDEERGGFVMLGKTFKGMTDETLAWQTEKLQSIATEREDYVVHVRPELVVEIAFNDVQKSPHYPGGFALRFARLKAYRDDKGPEQADTIATVRAIYRKQTGDEDDGERQLSLLPIE